ncbi:MAG: LysR family transcriptional regulator [Chitinophagales bacterium]
MNYTLRQLQIFLKITQTLSVTKAAEELHLTQPAVSLQLKNLQNQFDIPLTEVVGRKVFITDFGHEIAIAAEKILNEAYAINYQAKAFEGQITGRLKISVVSTGKYVMPYFLSDFLNKHSGVELMMDVTNKAQVIKSLEANEIDFALVSVLPAKIKTETISLMQNKLFMVANRNFKVSGRSNNRSALSSLPLIFREPGSATRAAMEKFIIKSGLTTDKKIELTSNEAVKQAVIAGLGCSIMPLIGIKNELMNGDLQIVPIAGLPIITTWQLIWLKQKKLSPVAQFYLENLKKTKSQTIKQRFDWYENY